jgi:hypothetical protein
MSIARRIAGMCAAVLALQLGLVRRDAACAPAPSQEGTMPMPGHEGSDHAPAPSHASMPVCCLAIASCGAFAGEARVVAVLSSAAAPRIGTRTGRLPVSYFLAPDPPPPRA